MFDTQFEQLLSQYADALEERSRFMGLAKDFFPGQQRQVNLLLSAYDLGLAKEIRTIGQITNAFAFRYVKRLVDEYGVSRINADWAVSMWCVCYGQHTLGKPCEIKIGSGMAGRAPAIQEEQTGMVCYGDLFTYERADKGLGYAVTGFRGEKAQTIIFQNQYNKQPVTEIKEHAFTETEVQEVILTEGFTRIEKGAFQGCGHLRQIILPQSLCELDDHALEGCGKLSMAALPTQLRRIGAYALSATGLKHIQIPKTVCDVGEGAFSHCTQIQKMEIPSNIGEIPAGLMRGCTGLRRVTLPEGLRAIGDEAFAGCVDLEDIYIPDSVTEIGRDVFVRVHEKFILMCSMGSFAESYARKEKLRYQLI